MKNYRVILLLLVALLSGNIAKAQNNFGKADDIGRIVLSPYVDSNGAIPEYAAKVMNNKLTQIASKNGVAGNSADQRFVITANLIELTKDVTPTAPPKVALTISPTLYIGDIITGELYASCELPSAKGVGDNDTKVTLRHPQTGETYYWEHAGKMDDPSYVESFKDRIKRYMQNGILPGYRLILTYETKDQPLTPSQVVEQITLHFFT